MSGLTKKIIFFILFLAFIALTVIVGFRDLSVGTDTYQYHGLFFDLPELDIGSTRFEPLFVIFTTLSFMLHGSAEIYFMSIFILIVSVYYMAFRFFASGVPNAKDNAYNALFFFGVLLLSSWFFVATTNGLRQGVSLVFLYLSLSLFLLGKKSWGVVGVAVSIGFHYSSVMILPFLLILYLKLRYILILLSLFAVGYFLSVNWVVVKFLSDLTGLGVYEFIASFAEGDPLWSGFQLSFFLYSISWLIVFLIMTRFVKEKYKMQFIQVVKVYSVLLMPYFIFGFSAFSNRIAVMAWFFIPISQGVFFAYCKFDQLSKEVVSVFMFLVGLIWYVSWFV